MSSPESITRQVFKERHGIADLPDSIVGLVANKRPIRNTPFHIVKFSGYSLIIPSLSQAREEIKRGDGLHIERLVVEERRCPIMTVYVVRKGVCFSHFPVYEEQIIPDDKFSRETQAVFERDRQVNSQRWII